MMIGFGNRIRTQAEVARLFNQEHPDLPQISQTTVSRIERQYRENGHVRTLPRNRQPKIDEETKVNVLLTYEDNPVTPARQVARDLGVSHTSVLKILKEEKKHPYKLQYVQELLEDDFDRRIQFCETMMDRIDRNQISSLHVLFSDEATFTLNGEVNRQNCRYWAPENPHWIRENHTQWPQKLNVWAGIIGEQIIGPIFLQGSLTGERYLEMLRDDIVPALAVLYPNGEDPDIPNEQVWLQQDGAPPHYALLVRQYLDQTFPGRWIGRRGAMEWPPRSPDLTPLDFFFWGYLKDRVYVQKPDNLADLEAKIRQEIRNIGPEILRNVNDGFYNRLALCQQVNGEHFQHLL